MRMRLRINTNKDGSQNYYVLESYRSNNGKSTTRIIKKLGTHDQLLKEHDDPKAWAESVVKEMNEQVYAKKQDILVKFSPTAQMERDTMHLYNGGYLFLQKLFYQLRLDTSISVFRYEREKTLTDCFRIVVRIRQKAEWFKKISP